MKAEYQQVFGKSVMAKVKDAEAIGSRTTWTTRDHLKVLSTIVFQAAGLDASEYPERLSKVEEALTECYNVSAFQQTLAKVPTFKAKGHFQREGAKGLSDIVAALEAGAQAKVEEKKLEEAAPKSE